MSLNLVTSNNLKQNIRQEIYRLKHPFMKVIRLLLNLNTSQKITSQEKNPLQHGLKCNIIVDYILFTITSAMVVCVSDLPWARVRFGPAPLTSC